LTTALSAQKPARPNIIVILADDIGYGDLSCYGATRVKTPNLDALAARGIRFTDAHASSATCTPTRYSLLTGEYAWRKRGTNILPGDAALVIEPERPTLPGVLKQAGYETGCVGKWHLGLGTSASPVNWNAAIAPGPREVGFDHSFIIPATGDRTPCVYVENGRVVGLDPRDPITVSYQANPGSDPTGAERPDLLKVKLTHGHDQTIVNGVSRIGYMSGGKSARWNDEQMARTITREATKFIERKRSAPFFLYFATHDIHVPRLPHPGFRGKSQCGIRCDALVEFDWSIGQITAALKRSGQLDNTLVIVTSDNGPVLDDGYADRAVEDLNGHTPAGALQGGKYSLYEGGTRVPFVAHWPARIQPGVSAALVSQVDLMASLAAIAGAAAPLGPDTEDHSRALLDARVAGRRYLVEHAGGLALRDGPWKYIPRQPGNKKKAATGAELYDLSHDLGERTNLAAAQPERATDMAAKLEEFRTRFPPR